MQARTIRLPGGVLDLQRRYRYKGEQDLSSFCEQWNYKPQQVMDTLAAVNRSTVASLDQRVHEGGSEGCSLGELISDPQEDQLLQMDLEMTVQHLQAAAGDDLALVELSIEGAKQRDLAELLGVSRRTAAGQVEDAKARLREVLQPAAVPVEAVPVEAVAEVLVEPAAEPILDYPVGESTSTAAAEAEREAQPQLPTLPQRLEQAWVKHQRSKRRERRRELVAA